MLIAVVPQFKPLLRPALAPSKCSDRSLEELALKFRIVEESEGIVRQGLTYKPGGCSQGNVGTMQRSWSVLAGVWSFLLLSSAVPSFAGLSSLGHRGINASGHGLLLRRFPLPTAMAATLLLLLCCFPHSSCSILLYLLTFIVPSCLCLALPFRMSASLLRPPHLLFSVAIGCSGQDAPVCVTDTVHLSVCFSLTPACCKARAFSCRFG